MPLAATSAASAVCAGAWRCPSGSAPLPASAGRRGSWFRSRAGVFPRIPSAATASVVALRPAAGRHRRSARGPACWTVRTGRSPLRATVAPRRNPTWRQCRVSVPHAVPYAAGGLSALHGGSHRSPAPGSSARPVRTGSGTPGAKGLPMTVPVYGGWFRALRPALADAVSAAVRFPVPARCPVPVRP